MKLIILFIAILILSGCGAILNTVKYRDLPPYEFVGIDGNCRQVKFNIDNESIEKCLRIGEKVMEVWLAGSFNNWASSKTDPVYKYGGPLDRHLIIMELDPVISYWIVMIPLQPGKYTYKYVVNTYKWIYDDATALHVDGFGGYTSIIIVPYFTADEIEKYHIDTNLNK
ncbi:MAG: hypothetical protein HPY53_13530 [Brevinematales bacterium]|nr:hypothetical protein [Brevinematales bacterium]